MSRDDVVTPSSPRSAHIVDATMGPLIGTGRLRRVFPFAATAIISLIMRSLRCRGSDPVSP